MNDLQGIADSCASDSNGTPAAASSALSGHSIKVTKEAKKLEEVEAGLHITLNARTTVAQLLEPAAVPMAEEVEAAMVENPEVSDVIVHNDYI